MAQSYQTTIEYIDSCMPASQRELVRSYSEQYGICEEVLQSLIFCESSYRMDAVNEDTGCYGICQINPIHGLDYNTEEKQLKKCCEMLIGFLDEIPDIGFAIARYNGQSKAYEDYEQGRNLDNDFVLKVLTISEQLERLHGK